VKEKIGLGDGNPSSSMWKKRMETDVGWSQGNRFEKKSSEGLTGEKEKGWVKNLGGLYMG